MANGIARLDDRGVNSFYAVLKVSMYCHYGKKELSLIAIFAAIRKYSFNLLSARIGSYSIIIPIVFS